MILSSLYIAVAFLLGLRNSKVVCTQSSADKSALMQSTRCHNFEALVGCEAYIVPHYGKPDIKQAAVSSAVSRLVCYNSLAMPFYKFKHVIRKKSRQVSNQTAVGQ